MYIYITTPDTHSLESQGALSPWTRESVEIIRAGTSLRRVANGRPTPAH